MTGPDPGRPQAVVFDFDGVLIDSEGLHLQAFQDAFGAVGWTLDRDTYYDRYLGYDDLDLIVTFVHDRGLSCEAAEIARLLDAKARRYARLAVSAVPLFPGAVACVRLLQAHFRLAIASGSLHSEISLVLDRAGLSDAFPVVVGADDVGRSKPAPDPYAEAVRRLGVRPADAVAIEDSRRGLESARTAGLRTIGITTSYAAAQLTPAEAIVSALDEVTPDLIRRVLMGHP